MSKINEADMLSDQENMAIGLGIDETPDRPHHAGNVAFNKAMLEVLPEGEVSQEVKDKNPFQYKYEVKVKKLPKKLKSVAGLKVGVVGRVVEVLDDKTVMIDFWTKTSPAKFPMRTLYLELHKTREQVELDAGVAVETKPDKEVIKHKKEVSSPVKFDTHKPRMDLVRPEFTLALGQALGYGAGKYSEEIGTIPNYLKGDGFNYSRIIGSLERHIAQWKMGEDFDEESNLSHLAHAAVNLMFLYTYSLSKVGIDDRIKLGDLNKKDG